MSDLHLCHKLGSRGIAPRAEIVLMPIGLCERFGVTHKAFFAYEGMESI